MSKRNDGITIERLPSGSYRYRTRDTNAGRYESATFPRLEEDAERDLPGTGAGDRWAAAQLARYRLGLSTAEPAQIGTVVNAYLAQLGRDRPHYRPLNPAHVAEVDRVLKSLVAFRPELDLNKTRNAKAVISEWQRQLKAVHQTASGRVLRRNLTLSASTKSRYLIHCKAMIKWAVDEGAVGRSPAASISSQSEDRTIAPVFTLTEVRTLLKKNRSDEPAWLWVALMMLAGLRRSEALALTWQDIHWKQSLLKVTKGKGSAARLVPLQADLRALLSPLGGPDAKVPRIGKVIAGDDFTGTNRKHEWTVFRRVLKSVGIEPDRGVDPITGRRSTLHAHSCRHTYGGMLLASGYDGMLLRHAMGHRQADTTGDYTQSASAFEAEIRAEGWEPGELRLLPRSGRKGRAVQ